MKNLLAGKAPLTVSLHTNMRPYCLLCCTGLSIVLPHTALLHTTAQTYCLICCTGLSIVSPPWLLRSLAQGTPDRCLHMSLDASRHLPPSVQSRKAPGSSLAPSANGVAFPQDLADRQARQTFVQQLQDQEVHQQWGKSSTFDCRLGGTCICLCCCSPQMLFVPH